VVQRGEHQWWWPVSGPNVDQFERDLLEDLGLPVSVDTSACPELVALHHEVATAS
jgi:hypothetical protein